MFNPDEIYTLEEIATPLKVSAKTIRRQLADKKQPGIKFMKIGDQIRIKGSDYNTYASLVSYPHQDMQLTSTKPLSEDEIQRSKELVKSFKAPKNE